MKVIFWFATKGYELALAPILQAGARAHGIEFELRPIEQYRAPEGDAGMICGVVKREVLWDHQDKSHPLLYIDKGYTRLRAQFGERNLPAFWRICVQATHPTSYFMRRERPSSRVAASAWEFNDRGASNGRYILIAGSSAKFHHTHKLPHPTAWATGIVEQLRQITDDPIIYRPKPSWADAQPIAGAEFDHGKKTPFSDALKRAKVVVTYGSIAGVEAVIEGCPCIVLGNSPAAPMSSLRLVDVLDPISPPIAERRDWAARLSFCHWTPGEIERGEPWPIIKEQLTDAL